MSGLYISHCDFGIHLKNVSHFVRLTVVYGTNSSHCQNGPLNNKRKRNSKTSVFMSLISCVFICFGIYYVVDLSNEMELSYKIL